MQIVRVELDGVFELIPATRAQGRLWFHYRGETYVIDVDPDQNIRRGTGGGAQAKSGVTTAPMPGKITRVGVRVGDEVAPGQVVIVMEAMKMEYTLEAEIAGEVYEVNVTEGAQVTLGEALVRVGAPK